MILLSLGIGIFSTVLPYFLYTRGLSGMDGGKASILVAVEPVVGAVIGMTVFGESRNILKIAGILLVTAAITLMNIPAKARKTIK
jgi:drug/metabolite transporter (DMT)-like permease